MSNEFIRTIEKARNAALEAVKAVPEQIRAQRIDVPKVEIQVFGRTLVSLPKRTIDLTSIELPKAEAFTDKLGQVKVFAPIDVDAIQARVAELGERVGDLPSKLQQVPSFVQSFVSDLPESATKLVEETTTKAKALLGDLKTRPILFVPARKPAAKKSPAKRKTTKKATAKTPATNGTTELA